jgi:hypothetical protein
MVDYTLIPARIAVFSFHRCATFYRSAGGCAVVIATLGRKPGLATISTTSIAGHSEP